jgi:hypothetical protein
MQLRQWLRNSDSVHATPAVAAQLRTPETQLNYVYGPVALSPASLPPLSLPTV